MASDDDQYPCSQTLTEEQIKLLFPIIKYVVDTYQTETDLTANGVFVQINDQTNVETIIDTFDKRIGGLMKTKSTHNNPLFYFYRVGDTKIGVKFTEINKSLNFDAVVNTLDKAYLNG